MTSEYVHPDGLMEIVLRPMGGQNQAKVERMFHVLNELGLVERSVLLQVRSSVFACLVLARSLFMIEYALVCT